MEFVKNFCRVSGFNRTRVLGLLIHVTITIASYKLQATNYKLEATSYKYKAGRADYMVLFLFIGPTSIYSSVY